MKPIATLLTALTLSGLIQTASQAQTPALTSTALGGARTYTGSIGFEFTLSANETLVSLGRLDIDSTDNTSQEVGIFDASSGTLLASANVGGSAATTGQYVYSSAITDTAGFNGLLLANTDYVIGTSGAETFLDDGTTSPTTSPAVTLVASRYGGTGFAFPDNIDHSAANGGGFAYTGPNFEYTTPGAVTPEPSTCAFLGAGALALFFIGKHRSRRA